MLDRTTISAIAGELHSGRHLEIEDILIPGRDPAGTQFGVGMGGADMLNDDVTAAVLAHHLHRDRARGGAHFAHEHPPNPTHLASQNAPTAGHI